MNRTPLLLALLFTASLAGCLSDDNETSDVMTHDGVKTNEPSYADATPAEVTGLEFITQTLNSTGEPLPTGAGVWVFGDFAFGSARTARFWIADVSNPMEPQVVYEAAEGSETVYARDADLIVHDDGRRTLALATQFAGLDFWDVTDPTNPEFLANVLYDEESDSNPAVHNVAVIPGTTLMFGVESGGAGKTNDLVDVSNPDNPVVLGTFGTHGCHDLTFHGSFGDDKFRGYCAGIQRTEIWDLGGINASAADFGIEILSVLGCPYFSPVNPGATDPMDLLEQSPSCATQSPVVGSPAFSTSPTRTLHHLAMVNHDASVLIIGDEFNGGGTPGACLAYDETTGASQPLGALWFYDIEDETNPTLLSWISPSTEESFSGLADTDPEAAGNHAADTIMETVDRQDPTYALRLTDPYEGSFPNCTAHFGTLVPGEEKIVMAWYTAGVLLIDFTDPAAPMILDQIKSEGTNPWDARVHRGYVFTGDIGRGMDVLRLV